MKLTSRPVLAAASAAVVALGALLLASTPAAAKTKPYRLAAAGRSIEKKWVPLPGHTAISRGVSLQIEYLEPAVARSAIERGLSRSIDLLPGYRDEKHPGFLVFLVTIANHAEYEIQFNPGQARLATEKGDMKFALDYSALYESARRYGPTGPTMDEMATVFFDRAIPIQRGGSVRKLLAFESPREDRWKAAEVMIVEIQAGAEAVDATFLFRKFEPAMVSAMEGR